ncbi:uncharacterized protein B0H64DRAFT_182513 [Chaetomium fimeti]|uniref:C2H2-type domain-containing protein n=1 Tax=Chaetomium fimeti TaxID=1854472 RepID=A0AAE0LR54_9PEZI|nr:hypothetical protein B0H64DRAFT_182513 [Chaetomium fimeti]
MDGSPTESGDNQIPISPSLPYDFLHVQFQQAPPGGVGTTGSYGTAASSSFASSPEIMTPAASDCSVSFVTPLSPTISVENARSTPEIAHSDQESDSSSTGSRGPFRCTDPKCTSKKKVFKLKCQLRKHANNHTRPKKCDYCDFRGGAERKDLARHLRTCHSDIPQVRGDRALWKEVAPCARCGREMRADNLKRSGCLCVLVSVGGFSCLYSGFVLGALINLDSSRFLEMVVGAHQFTPVVMLCPGP